MTMQRPYRTTLPALLAVLCAPALALAAEALAVKPGHWETTTTTTTSGISIPPEVISSMPEAQREQMQSMMKQMGMGAPSTRTERNCVTEQDIKEGVFKALRESEQANCTHKVVKSTSKQQEIEMTCGGQVSGTGRMTVDVIDGDNVRGQMDIKAPAMTMNMKFTSRRLGASCPAEKAK